ncbi:hypothetical protein QF037_009327 [Streptomyces canus]|nr:hypothetical protein [Streptomyces canus]
MTATHGQSTDMISGVVSIAYSHISKRVEPCFGNVTLVQNS